MLEQHRQSTKMSRSHSSTKISKEKPKIVIKDELYGIGTLISRTSHSQTNNKKSINQMNCFDYSKMHVKSNSELKIPIKDPRFRRKSENSATDCNIQPILHNRTKSNNYSLIWDSLIRLTTPKLDEECELRVLLGPPKMLINTELFPLEEAMVDAMD
jgi:hypothetical protein